MDELVHSWLSQFLTYVYSFPNNTAFPPKLLEYNFALIFVIMKSKTRIQNSVHKTINS